jgi:hypothetical protein
VADLQINYEKLHTLAQDARLLKDHLDDKVPGLGTNGGTGFTAGSAEIGSQVLFGKLNKFQLAWEGPFKDAMDKLDDLAGLLDGVATKFFDMDADFASKANTMLASLRNNAWQSKEDAYQHYLATKDKTFTYHYWDENGNYVTATRPLVDWSNPDNPPPTDPGPRPTNTSDHGANTDTGYDSHGRVTTETSTVTSSSGLSYQTTTTYTYNGDGTDPTGFTTTITHSDGTTETIVQNTNADGTYNVVDTTPDGHTTSVVTPKPTDGGRDTGYSSTTTDQDGKVTTTNVTNNPDGTADTKVVVGTDGTTTTYTGDSDTGWWTETSKTPPPTSDDDDYWDYSNY